MKKIGFIGVGNMGGTLANVATAYTAPENILVSSRTLEKAEAFALEHGFCPKTNLALAAEADYIFLGVKPQKMKDVLEELAPILAHRADHFVLVTMAAGLTTEQICNMACGHYPVIRIMPNTPVLVGEGVISYCSNALVTEADCNELESILHSGGLVTALNETFMDAASAVSGCGPAFVYLFIEALSDGAVACGLPRKIAMQFASQMVIGAAKMVLETDLHPGALKDAVCSPGGSTIVGVKALEDGAFRASAANAIIAAYNKTKALGNS